MTIASEIERIKTNIANAYTALGEKGASLPEVQNSTNLADTVATVVSGGEGSGGSKLPAEYSVFKKYLEKTALDTTTGLGKCVKYIKDNDITGMVLVGFLLNKGFYKTPNKTTVGPSGYMLQFNKKFVYCKDAFNAGLCTSSEYADSLYFMDNPSSIGHFSNVWDSYETEGNYIECIALASSSSIGSLVNTIWMSGTPIGRHISYIYVSGDLSIAKKFIACTNAESIVVDTDSRLLPLVKADTLTDLDCFGFAQNGFYQLKQCTPLNEWVNNPQLSTDVLSYLFTYTSRSDSSIIPEGLDLSNVESNFTIASNSDNSAACYARSRSCENLKVILPSQNITFNTGYKPSPDSWRYLAEHAPVVSGKSITFYENYYANILQTRYPDIYNIFIEKGWTIS